MCSSKDPTAVALEKSRAKTSDTLAADYDIAFAHNMQVANQMKARMDAMATNPMGYTKPQLALARTSINETTATAAKQAMGSAAAFAASHGGADVGNGAVGQLAGEIGAGATLAKSQQLAQLSQQDEQLKQENYWRAISGLGAAGSEYGSAGGTAIGASTGQADASVSAGKLNLEAKQAGWQNAMGVVSGIGGLVTAGAGIPGVHV